MIRHMSTGQIWGMPIVLGLLSTLGLLSALLGDGPWDALSWVSLATPVFVSLWFVWRSFHRHCRITVSRS
jgi:hypothetical protein